ncbi:MAG: hypothetical protein O3A00_24070, partial [Planctomycetota bacterium]|nr:hypothetical protein [Planctomycetota bacterium]
MPIEVACGNCQGRLMAETPGTIVACPHCGAHLTVPGTEPAPAAAPVAHESEPKPVLAEQQTAADSPLPSFTPPDATNDAPESFPDFLAPSPAVFSAPDEDEPAFPDFSAPAPVITSSPVAETAPGPEASATAVETAPAAVVAEAVPAPVAASSFEPTPSSAPPQPATAIPESSTGRRNAKKPSEGRVSRTMFIIVASYASAVTCFLIFVFSKPDQFFKPTAGEMESLPDLPNRKGTILGNGGKLPESSFLLPKQKLKIGDEPRRLGNVEISVIKVVKGPLEIVPFSAMIDMGGNPGKVEQTQDVLQLWIKLKNVSKDQRFSPIDFELLRNPEPVDPDLLDTFVAKAGVNVNATPRIHVY